jgi:hypothetical protein
MLSNQSSRKDKQTGWLGRLNEPDEISEVVRERRPGKSDKGTVIPSKI